MFCKFGSIETATLAIAHRSRAHRQQSDTAQLCEKSRVERVSRGHRKCLYSKGHAMKGHAIYRFLCADQLQNTDLKVWTLVIMPLLRVVSRDRGAL